MIAVVDADAIGASDLRAAIDDLEESVADSLPRRPELRSLAAQAERGDVSDEVVDAVLDAIPELLRHDRSSVHRIAAVAGVVLVGAKPAVADDLLDRLVPMLEETVTERRTMEALEYVATAAPEAVAEHRSVAVGRLTHPRDGVARHAAGTLLAIATGSPERVVETVPELLASLTEKFEPVTSGPREIPGGDLQALEHHRRLEHESSRLLVARTIARVTEARPEDVAEVVIDSGSDVALASLFDDHQSRVRAAAVGVASHVAERNPEAIESALPRVIELLDDETEVVRGGAIWTLGALDHPQAAEGLRTAREDDPSEELRELAAAVGSDDEPKFI